MLTELRERVHSAVPADRLGDYNLHRADRVRLEDVGAIAEAQARYMVAGPKRDPANVDPELWRMAVTMLKGVFNRRWSGPLSTELHLDPPAKGRLSEVRVPSLVINGLDDVPWIQDVSDLLTAGIPHARRIDLPNTGHLPPLERPQQVTDALRELLTAT
jgi:pimeloyl-ACP methyl ester carboxylesterase